MGFDMEPLGIAAELQERRQRIVKANVGRMGKGALAKFATEFSVTKPRPALVVKPIFEKGRYIPKSLTDIIAVVARLADTTPEAICGSSHRRFLVNARACVANLASEFASHQSDAAIDSAMLRGQGMTRWYRERHADRVAAFPSYGVLYHRCRAELAK